MVSIPLEDIELSSSEPDFVQLFTHARCPRPMVGGDGTNPILLRPANDRLYCASCGRSLDDQAEWAVRASGTPEPGRSRMVVNDFRGLKRSLLGNARVEVQAIEADEPLVSLDDALLEQTVPVAERPQPLPAISEILQPVQSIANAENARPRRRGGRKASRRGRTRHLAGR